MNIRSDSPTDFSAPPKSSWWFCPRVPIDRWKVKWIQVKLYDGTIAEAHWACNLSGEEQPPFIGWFNRNYREVHPEFWRKLDA